MAKDLKAQTQDRAAFSEEKVRSRMVREFCKVLVPMLPMPRTKVIELVKSYGLHYGSLMAPKRLATHVILKTDNDGQCIWAGPA